MNSPYVAIRGAFGHDQAAYESMMDIFLQDLINKIYICILYVIKIFSSVEKKTRLNSDFIHIKNARKDGELTISMCLYQTICEMEDKLQWENEHCFVKI